MNTIVAVTGIPPDVMADLQTALEKAAKGIRDPEAINSPHRPYLKEPLQ